MILTLLAALYGAAQEAFVVYEGAESNYFIDDHPGSTYSWKVLVDFNPDTEANPDNFTFTSSETDSRVSIRWDKPGLYYLDVIETDISGCTNRKAMAVNVLSNNRSISFETLNSSACFSDGLNDFRVDLQIAGDNGNPLEEAYFPITVKFNIEGTEYSQAINYDNQSLYVSIDFAGQVPEADTQIVVNLLNATDVNDQVIPSLSGNSSHTRIIFAKPQIQFVYFDDRVKENNEGHYQVELVSGEAQNTVYHWWIDPPEGTSTDLSLENSDEAHILWDGPPGLYNLHVSASNGNACAGDTISRAVEIEENLPSSFVVNAGPDTTIGGCETYTFASTYPPGNAYSYLWSPSDYLNDPTAPNPVFTPGETTTYILTVTDIAGTVARDTVTISVSNIVANAGDDRVMEEGGTIMLDGSASTGEALSYLWRTENGTINSGENTAFPVVSDPGTYYLEVTDVFGCTALDSVVISQFVLAPVLKDIYDTTSYQKSVTIQVVTDTQDPQAKLDPSTMQIIQDPVYGSLMLDYFEGSITYTPNDGYIGKDAFEYQICNFYSKCDNAYVYVYVAALDFLIPEAFTPNGDNINDFFEIKGIEMYPNNSITIINRWGKKVYEAQRYGIETNPRFWDGKSNQGGGNGDLPTGTYYYVLDLGNGEKPIAGSVYIDR